jgi:hypothetical protein
MNFSVDEIIQHGWLSGFSLAVITTSVVPLLAPPVPLNVAHRAVMDRVRTLGLPERCPVTLRLEPGVAE